MSLKVRAVFHDPMRAADEEQEQPGLRIEVERPNGSPSGVGVTTESLTLTGSEAVALLKAMPAELDKMREKAMERRDYELRNLRAKLAEMEQANG